MSKFTFVTDPAEKEIVAYAATEKEAHRKAWEQLTDNEQDRLCVLDCVDEQFLIA